MKAIGKIELRTGCRLHFGLMELCPDEPNCFSGMGLMLDSPGVHLELTKGTQPCGSAEEVDFQVPVELQPKILSVLTAWGSQVAPCDFPYAIGVAEALPLHCGLGAGTQTACATATLLCAFSQQAPESREWKACNGLMGESPETWLVENANRGLRSAIGVQGFLSGGLICDQGYLPRTDSSDELDFQNRPVQTRVAYLNSEWRVVLLIPNQHNPVAGEQEAGMIKLIGHQANKHRDAMRELADTMMEIADAGDDLNRFADMLDQYTEYAGRVFASMQGGQYSSQTAENLVSIAREAGLVGVGQSSWGPTIFGFCSDVGAAQAAKQTIESKVPEGECSVMISKPATQGAQVRWVDSMDGSSGQ